MNDEEQIEYIKRFYGGRITKYYNQKAKAHSKRVEEVEEILEKVYYAGKVSRDDWRTV